MLIKPHQLSKTTEASQQRALFCWANVAMRHGFVVADQWAKISEKRPLPEIVKVYELASVPCLEWMHAIPNGGSRGDTEESRAIRGAALKAEGVKKGIPDIFLPHPMYDVGDARGEHAFLAGLYIEMKRPNGGVVSVEQKEFGEYARRVGYRWEVCPTWQEAATAIQTYIEG